MTQETWSLELFHTETNGLV